MKNILIILLVLPVSLICQSMTWIPSPYVEDLSCEDLTDCNTNTVCYKLQYTPDHTGILTSYTSCFFVDCLEGSAKIKSNSSCSMVDNSRYKEACDDYGKIILNCAGNTGGVSIKAGKSTMLHQVCFDLSYKQSVMIKEEKFVGVTTSINLENGKAISEMPTINQFAAKNTVPYCDKNLANLILKVSQLEKSDFELTWEPVRESGSGHYDLYRTDVSLVEKILITSIKDKNYSTTTNMYKFIDNIVNYGDYFYHVEYHKGVQSIESNRVAVSYQNKGFSVTVNPNPSIINGIVTCYVTGQSNQVEMVIHNDQGQYMMKKMIDSYRKTEIDLSGLNVGVYFALFTSQNNRITKKLILIE